MLTLNWKGEQLQVRRLLIHSDTTPEFARRLAPIARRNSLDVGDETSVPQAGDFWVGCNPIGGWGDADPAQVGWASLVEVPVAIAQLQAPLQILEDLEFDASAISEGYLEPIANPFVLEYA